MLPNTVSKTVDLNPGDIFFGSGNVQMKTLLGSCVAITVWHPELHLGGMCHYLLAYRNPNKPKPLGKEGYYADDALDYFCKQIDKSGTLPSDYHVKMFGGSNMFDRRVGEIELINIAQDNVLIGKKLLKERGFTLKVFDTGGIRYRKLNFSLISGEVWVQYGKRGNIDK